MNGSRRHSAGDGKLGRSSSDAAFRGTLLVAVAVLIGALLLWRGHDDSAATAIDTTDGNGVTTTTAPRITTTAAGQPGTTAPAATAAPPVTRAPAQVKVLVANGTGTPQGAGTVTNKLVAKGYGTLPASNASSANVVKSVIFYREGFAEDAKQVARDLAVAEPIEAVIEAMPASPPVAANAVERAKTADVLVILGTDGKIKQT
jgi:hypothetical protein